MKVTNSEFFILLHLCTLLVLGDISSSPVQRAYFSYFLKVTNVSPRELVIDLLRGSSLVKRMGVAGKPALFLEGEPCMWVVLQPGVGRWETPLDLRA